MVANNRSRLSQAFTGESPPSVPDWLADGAVIRECRTTEIEKVSARVRRRGRHARKNARRSSECSPLFPQGLHWRVVKVRAHEVILVLIEDPFPKVERLPISQCCELVDSKRWIPTDYEPLPVLRFGEGDLTARQIATRDRNVALIKPLIDLGDELFAAMPRGAAIRQICKSRGCAPMTVYRVLNRYFQGGMDINSLAGRWYRRSRGINRGARLSTRASSCVGRTLSFGKPRLDGVPAFVVRDVDVTRMTRGADRHYYAPEGVSWHRAWLRTLGDYYIAVPPGMDFLTDEELSKHPPGSYPSEFQFRYWNKIPSRLATRLKKRGGQRRYNLRHRPLGDKTERHAIGPGSHYIIDPTPFDLVVVHQITRRPIGRLVLYLIIDAFSRLIVGFFVFLGNAGFDPASVALITTAVDKVQLCRQFGITIRPEDWPGACLPGELIADSELSSLRAHALVERKVLKLRIVPAYRPDLKGLVEALLGAANQYAHSLPGYTDGRRKRAEVPPEATAALDHIQVNRIIIRWILSRNRRILDNYSMTDEMIADGLVPTPINIWNWGVANRRGRGKKRTTDYLIRHCLPTGDARITRRGLEFRGHFFEPQAGYLPDFDASRVEASWRPSVETVTYNPNWVHDLWLHAGPDLIPMKLTAESSGHADWSYADLDAAEAETRAAAAATVSADVPQQVALETASLCDVKAGLRATEEARGTVAQRRRERVDKPAERQSQSDIIRGAPRRRPKEPSPATPTDLANEDELDAAGSILASLHHEDTELQSP